MKNIIKSPPRLVILSTLLLAISACATITAKEPYRTAQGEDLLIVATMQAGQIKFFINGKTVIEGDIFNGGAPINGIFPRPYTGTYEKYGVTAQCKHTKNFFSVENECDVFIDGKFAANLYLR